VSPSITPTASPTPTTIPGDCAGNGVVSIEDLITGVNIALDNLPISACPAFDVNGDGKVTIDELILAINAALMAPPQ
jgi:hypothetical protein